LKAVRRRAERATACLRQAAERRNHRRVGHRQRLGPVDGIALQRLARAGVDAAGVVHLLPVDRKALRDAQPAVDR
jgi:hypothetical protein